MIKKFCNGCYQDRYNHKRMCERPGIDAPVSSNECWHLKTAKRIRLVEIPINQTPPYHQKSSWYPSCYSRPGYNYIPPHRIVGGYIK